MKKLTHLDKRGKAKMVDVGGKPSTAREATARGSVYMKKETLKLIGQGNIPKGDVLPVARVAGIMAAKKTSGLIPMCHTLNLSSVDVDLELDGEKVNIRSKVSCKGQTDVEMEALTAVAVAALTVYDMCKAVDKEMTISDIVLVEKKGGKSGPYKRS
jgi:cyclic pyranopterin phosphate synthase